MCTECGAPWCELCSLIVTVLICTSVLHIAELRGDMDASDDEWASRGVRAFALNPGSHSCPEGSRAGQGQGRRKLRAGSVHRLSHLACDLCQPGGGVSVVSFAFLCSWASSDEDTQTLMCSLLQLKMTIINAFLCVFQSQSLDKPKYSLTL